MPLDEIPEREPGPAELHLREGLRALHLEAPEQVVRDLTKLVNEALDEVQTTLMVAPINVKLAEMEVGPNTVLTLYLPKSAPREAFEAAKQGLRQHFPDTKLVLLHNDAKLEAEEG